MQCPQCHVAMTSCAYEGVQIKTCESCGGEFLGPAELAHIVQTRDQRFPASTHDLVATNEPQFGIPARQASRRLSCPNCQCDMKVINYWGDTGVFIDRCPECDAVWLDHAELEKLQARLERWSDEAPEKLQSIAGQLELARQDAASRSMSSFAGSRFAFVNALINRFLDAA